MNQRTKKFMTIHKDFNSRNDIDSVCQEKKEEENIEECIDATNQGFKKCTKKRKTNFSNQ